MGDASNFGDLERFTRSPEGKAYLERIEGRLVNRRIESMKFVNQTHAIGIELLLDNGTKEHLFVPGLEVEALRKTFETTLEREYHKDYPDRPHT